MKQDEPMLRKLERWMVGQSEIFTYYGTLEIKFLQQQGFAWFKQFDSVHFCTQWTLAEQSYFWQKGCCDIACSLSVQFSRQSVMCKYMSLTSTTRFPSLKNQMWVFITPSLMFLTSFWQMFEHDSMSTEVSGKLTIYRTGNRTTEWE